jgi:hypothetical protein
MNISFFPDYVLTISHLLAESWTRARIYDDKSRALFAASLARAEVRHFWTMRDLWQGFLQERLKQFQAPLLNVCRTSGSSV